MYRKTCLLLFFCVISVSCGDNITSGDGEYTIDALPRALSSTETSLISNTNEFGFRLLKEVNKTEPDKNLFISPLSVSMALGMTYNGTDGDTKTEMHSVLGYGNMNDTEINDSYKSLIDLLTGLDHGVDFSIANSIWHRNTFQAEQSFLNTCRDYFYAEVAGLDFSSPQAVSTINNWVANSTSGKIEKIIEQIPGNVIMYLINAIYFKGSWSIQFDKNNTYDGIFNLLEGTPKNITMMKERNDFFIFQSHSYSAIDLDYGGKAFSMSIFLPTDNQDINAMINNFSSTFISEFDDNRLKQEIYVHLPKFKLEYENKLNNELIDMGMPSAFGPGADFSRIQSPSNLKIDEVKHKTFVEVNEEGTTAAAVTSVSMTDSAPMGFYLDRPFLFIIREKLSGTVLFIGKIVDPESN